MRLSDKTLKILQNFTTINQSLFFKEGNKLRTISVMKNVLAEAEIDEYIPRDFAIYDLPQFLNTLSLYQSPEVDVSTNTSHALIKDGNNRAKFFFSDPSVIIAPPEKEMQLPSEDVSFKLTEADLTRILKSSSIMQLPDMSVVGENGAVRLVVSDRKNDTSNEYSIAVGETDREFSFNFKIENMRLIPRPYEVLISSKNLAKFYNPDFKLTYFIALEPDSTCD
jgi:hypothetical protein|tara:strand:- start:3048 stop:3716 length:669 start_codon:yes stop_codon:yes gene_type:complete